MIPLGYTYAEMTDLWALLYTNYTLEVTVRLLDVSHNYLDDLSDQFVDGNVVVDVGGSESDRALDITFLDPLKAIHLDADSPSPTSMFIANMISVVYTVISPDNKRAYNIPVFCGPIDTVNRNGVFLNVTCLGKEKLASDTAWVGRTWKKKYVKTEIIKQLLAQTGENKLGSIPDLPHKTNNVFALKRDQNPWQRAKALASSMSCQLFYDGRGVPRLRYKPKPTKTSFTFTDQIITTLPQFGYDLKSAVNAVQVIGGKPKGAKKRLSYRIVAPDSHPLSPKRLGRNGVPRYINSILIDDDSLKKMADIKAMAKKTLNAQLMEATEVTFDAYRIPMLEPLDAVMMNYSGMSTAFALKQFNIPLRNSGDSGIGYLHRAKPKGKKPITRKKK